MASKRALGLLRPIASSSRAASSVAASTSSAPAPTPAPVESERRPAKQYLDFPPLQRLTPTHGVHVATLHLRAYHPYNLDLAATVAQHAARSLQMPTSGVAHLPTTKELITVPRSAFVQKKSQENFGRLTHRRTLKVYDTDSTVLDLWLRYIKKNAPGGVGLKAYIHEYAEFGFARGEMEGVEGMMGGDVERAADEIVKALSGEEFAAPQVEAKVEAETTPKTEAQEAQAGRDEIKAAAQDVAEATREVDQSDGAASEAASEAAVETQTAEPKA